MVKYIGIALAIVSSLSANAQYERGIVINPAVRISISEEKTKALNSEVLDFLNSTEKTDKDPLDQDLVKAIRKVTEMPEYANPSFRWQLINLLELDEAIYSLQLSYSGVLENGSAFSPLTITLLSRETGSTFAVSSPFYYQTRQWKSEVIGKVSFHYQYVFNREEALAFSRHNEYLARKLNLETLAVNYYKCRNLQEVYRLLGVDYSVRINGQSRGSHTNHRANVFLSGTNTDEYKHDLTHYYFEQAVPDSVRNWMAEEGYNITLTDYWGGPRENIFGYLRSYLNAKPRQSTLEVFNNNEPIKAAISARTPIVALIMGIIEREGGFKRVLEVITAGPSKEDFLKSIANVAGITSQNFSSVVDAELNTQLNN